MTYGGMKTNLPTSLTLTLGKNDWTVLYFAHKEIVPNSYWIGGQVDSRAILDTMIVNIKIPATSRNLQSRPYMGITLWDVLSPYQRELLWSHVTLNRVCSNYIIMKIHYLKRILKNCFFKMWGFCYLSLCVVETTDWMKKNFVFNSWQGQEIFPCIQTGSWGPPSLLYFSSKGWSCQALKLTTQGHLLPKLQTCRSLSQIRHTSSWHGASLRTGVSWRDHTTAVSSENKLWGMLCHVEVLRNVQVFWRNTLASSSR